MAKLLKLRRGTTTQHGSFTGAEGEVTVDTDKATLVVHDGSTAGGHPVAAEDMANVSSSAIAGRLSNDSLATSKLAAGALPSDVTVASANLVDGTIVNADVNESAAIAGSKISPDFGSQNITTDGNVNLPDNSKIQLGGSNDLQIFHDGNHSRIKDTGTGDMVFHTNTVAFRDAADSENIARFNEDGDCQLFHNNVLRIQTTSSGATITGNIGVTGTVDGRDVATDGTKLDGIESSATADQTAAEIRTLVESASDSNVFTDADHSKLNGIEASATADQSNAEIRAAVEAASDSNVFTDADHTKLNGIETSATADQTASEIVSLIAGQTIAPHTVSATNNVYGPSRVGRDSNDYISFGNNDRMDVYINGSNEFRFESDGDFHADGDVVAFSTTVSSDRKLKENIQVVPNALDKVEALNGVTFDWKRDGTPSAGVIAQEVQEVLPEAVKEVTPLKGGDSHLSVNYHALTSILIEAIKELKAEVEQLKGGQ